MGNLSQMVDAICHRMTLDIWEKNKEKKNVAQVVLTGESDGKDTVLERLRDASQ